MVRGSLFMCAHKYFVYVFLIHTSFQARMIVCYYAAGLSRPAQTFDCLLVSAVCSLLPNVSLLFYVHPRAG